MLVERLVLAARRSVPCKLDHPAIGVLNTHGGIGGIGGLPSAMLRISLERELTATLTGSRITPAKAIARNKAVMRFIWVVLLVADSLAGGSKEAVIVKNVQKTEQRGEWLAGNLSTEIGD